MEQASGSFMTGIREFTAYLPFASLLSPSTLAFQVNTGVSNFWIMLKTSTLLVALSSLLF